MQQEIERKFLVINNIYKNGSVSTFYKQGYLCTDASRTVRIRIAGEKGFITIKGITTGCSRKSTNSKEKTKALSSPK